MIDRLALQTRLAELCGDLVPGAAVAVTDGTGVVEVVHGVTSLRTQQPVTPATLFQVGSITKVYTATLVMQLVDEGKVDLDAPVQTYLPWFQVADADVSAAVTVRHLLCHTSGFEGDDFTDTGRGDEALRVYVEGLAKAAQIAPLGAMFSYCNSGFSVLGLLVTEVLGTSWDEALLERIAAPLGLTLATLPEQVILQPHALGHLPGPDGLDVAPVYAPPRSVGPAGTINSSAADVLAFGKGRFDLLSAASVAAMTTEQVLMDDPNVLGRAWGLGWILPVEGVIGHDGATFGQYAFYRLHPASGAGMVLLTNGPGARGVFDALFAEFFAPLCGVDLPRAPVPAAEPPAITDADRYVGVYERQEVRLEVAADDEGLTLTITPLGPTAALAGQAPPIRLVGFSEDTLISAEPIQSGVHMTARFLGDGPQARWIHVGGRATPRLT